MEIFDAIHKALDAVVDKALTLVIAGFVSEQVYRHVYRENG